MKYLTIVLGTGLVLLSGCDNNKHHIEQVLRCGYAVNEVGDDNARAQYHKNELTALGGKLPVIDRYALMRISQRARDASGVSSHSEKVRIAQLVYEYNATPCLALHRQPPISQQQMKKMMGENVQPQPAGPHLLLPPAGSDA